MIRFVLFCFLFIINHSFSQLAILGNTKKICLTGDSNVSKVDTLPADLTIYKAVMIFSNSTSSISDGDVERLINYVESGGGLYLGSENFPLQAESNQITRTVYNKESYGAFSSKTATVAETEGNLRLSTDDTLPAGNSTVAFPLDYRLNVEAWVNDEPLILTGLLKDGRIVIDGGYSRFYCDQNVPETQIVMKKIIDFLTNNSGFSND